MSHPSQQAWNSLSVPSQSFIQSLPKAELHAHLNGSIPLDVLTELAVADNDQETIRSIARFKDGVNLEKISDFFSLFPAIYRLTSTPAALTLVTQAVINDLLSQCTYLELRSTPRKTEALTRKGYVETVLGEIEKYPAEIVGGLILSLDRRMSHNDMQECVDIAISMREEGRRVIGIDLCGDPYARDVAEFEEHFQRARESGLGITVHIAETAENTVAETLRLLSYQPTRLGHATFLNDQAQQIVLRNKIPIELCLTSNLLCKTVSSLEAHHIKFWLDNDHPIAISTDDTLPFRTKMQYEYALLLAQPPFGLGLSEDQVEKIARGSLACKMCT